MSIIDEVINTLEEWRNNNPASILCNDRYSSYDCKTYLEELDGSELKILELYNYPPRGDNIDSIARINNKQPCYELKERLESYFMKDDRKINFKMTEDDEYMRLDIEVYHWYCVEHTFLFDPSEELFNLIKRVCWCPRGRGPTSKRDNFGDDWIKSDEVFQQIIDHPDDPDSDYIK